MEEQNPANGFKVNSVMCETCIFKPDKSLISAESFESYRLEREARWLSQECHDATLNDQHVACRGDYENWKAGNVHNYPIRAVAALWGLSDDVPSKTIAEIYERLNLIVFVEIEPKP